MRMIVNISYIYEVDANSAEKTYGTTDPEAMAAVDQQAFRDDPSILAEDMSAHEIQVTVRPDISSVTG